VRGTGTATLSSPHDVRPAQIVGWTGNERRPAPRREDPVQLVRSALDTGRPTTARSCSIRKTGATLYRRQVEQLNAASA